ncbi:MAG: NAD(P)/FAD-dependent oxidoreductase [Saprospiraceae bacterium]|nr:NAD(P)/FAD-dependent oxidoreductase [Pyrinomonadaceae bacterium]
MPQSIAIIGSGFLGLTLALRLSEQGAKVTVFESAPEIGGLASSWKIGDVVWDRHYHVTLLSDSFTRKVVEEIGLGDEFEWVETKTGFYTGGKLVSMSNALEFLKFPPLGLVSKFRLGATIFYASRVKDWKALEKIPVADWLIKLSGKKTFEKVWRPLLKAKLGEAYRETSAAFIWATIQRMYAARKSGMKKEMFGYVRGGYARVLGRFEKVLRERGVEIRLNSPVSKVEKLKNGLIGISTITARTAIPAVETVGAEALHTRNDLPGHGNSTLTLDRDEFDSVVLTCPADIAAKIVPQLTTEEKRKLENVKYQGIVCASVLLKKSLSEFYVTNIIDETPFTGIVEMSALVDKKAFGGNALVYLPKYVTPDDELFERSDAEIEELFLDALEKMYPHFSRTDVEAFRVSRVKKVFPLPVLNYSGSLPSIETSVEGVIVVNSAHIVNGTLNVNETVRLAENFYADHCSPDARG